MLLSIPSGLPRTWSHPYGTQFVKCGKNCCRPFRCPSFLRVLPNRFLPFPRVIVNTPALGELDHKKKLPDEAHFATLSRISWLGIETPKAPFDLFCPSVRKLMPKRICPVKKCGKYFPSHEAMLLHRRKYTRQGSMQLCLRLTTLQSLMCWQSAEVDIYSFKPMARWNG